MELFMNGAGEISRGDPSKVISAAEALEQADFLISHTEAGEIFGSLSPGDLDEAAARTAYEDTKNLGLTRETPKEARK